MSRERILLNRRTFQHSLAGILAASPLLHRPSVTWSQQNVAPSDRIQVGVIGLGSRGFNLLDELMQLKDIDVPVVCDVDRLHYRDRPWGKGTTYGREAAQEFIEKKRGQKPEAVSDFRQVCQRQDLDAIVIATPDHWHALCTLTALRHNKAVYCEKPVTHWFAEGLEVCREVRERGAVFQTGSQQRSDEEFRTAVSLVRAGILGRLQRVEVGLPSGYDKPQDTVDVSEPPPGLDYDLWCGPAEKLPYMRARHHRWWRGHRAFGGGVLMDWIGHHNDIAHWAMDLDQGGPTRVEAIDWEFPATDVYNTPWHYTIRSEYANGVVATISDQHTLGTKFLGTDGWLHVTRGKLTTSNAAWNQPGFDLGSARMPASPGHMRNFVDCIRSKELCIAPAETAHRSITPGHLGYVSNALKRALQWDAATQTVVGDPEANQLLRYVPYRQPWSLDSVAS